MDNSQAAEQVKSIGVQAVLETFRTTTGFPWWATLILSDVAVRAAIFPFYVLVLGEVDVNEGNFRLYKAALGVQYRGHIYARIRPQETSQRHAAWVTKCPRGDKKVQYASHSNCHWRICIHPYLHCMAYSARDMVRCGKFAGLDFDGLCFGTT
ncbi:unnamed protein product [Peronospora belbahrii]|uniref:Uncharacterized protein n=1 Tax=Peronospora belbahrii TaxID=622444 RepID=A0ABN8CMK0_9STRA|nr:unnamed protein product [Peronospora belbahrii]